MTVKEMGSGNEYFPRGEVNAPELNSFSYGPPPILFPPSLITVSISSITAAVA